MKTEAKFDLSVVGELNLDLILYGLPTTFELDREHLASGLCLTLGSSSAIFAHNFVLLGNRVAFHSVIGNDALGEICLKRLGQSDADVSGVRRLAGRQTGLTVVLPQPHKRFIRTYLGVMAEMRFEGSRPDACPERAALSSIVHLPATSTQTPRRRTFQAGERSRAIRISGYK
jgi:sugar/nucleoside kinase (ribokinase family)